MTDKPLSENEQLCRRLLQHGSWLVLNYEDNEIGQIGSDLDIASAEIRALEEGLRKIEHESHYQGLLTDINYGRSGALNRIHAIAHNLTGGEDDRQAAK